MRDAEAGRWTASPLVLIAEDEEPIAQALAFIIEDAGYTTRIAVHGKQAIEFVREQRPALIITDLMMPRMTGAELIASVRAEAAAAGELAPPIILMSAAGERFTATADADAVLAKPFDITEVEKLLRRFIPF